MRTHKNIKMEMFFNESTAVELVLLTVPVFILDVQILAGGCVISGGFI